MALIAVLAKKSDAETFLIETESLQFKADWTEGVMGSMKTLETLSGTGTPMTVFEAKEESVYGVWANSFDYAHNKPGTRLYEVYVNFEKLPNTAGLHKRDGFYWEKLGEVKLVKGENLLSIKRLESLVRSDAILFTNDKNFNPNAVNFDVAKRTELLRKPITKQEKKVKNFPKLPESVEISEPKVFTISNGKVRMSFIQKQGLDGQKIFERSVELFKDGSWLKVQNFKEEKLFLIKDKKPNLANNMVFPVWNDGKNRIKVSVGNKEITLAGVKNNPYEVGAAIILRPINVVQSGNLSFLITYDNGATASLILEKNGYAARFEVETPIEDTAFYSLGICAFNSYKDGDFTATLMPPLYQARRTMSEPKAVSSGFLSHPLSLVESNFDGVKISNAIIADVARVPFEWFKTTRPFFAMSLSNDEGLVQASAFSPLLGAWNSKKEAGSTLKVRWHLMSVAESWEKALSLVNEEILKSNFIREPFDTSLSDAVCNMAEFLKDARHSGWDAELKGRYNIESKSTVTQASPLAELSIALLTDDEDYYANISLPTIEYTLSRPSTHFFKKLPAESPFLNESMSYLRVPSSFNDGGYFAGLNFMLGNANPFFKEFYKDSKGNWKGVYGGGKFNWQAMIGIYLADPNAALLQEIIKDCDMFLKENFDNPPMGEYVNNFSNCPPAIPYWWNLIDLYEITKDEKYLKYAQVGAFYSASMIWSYPIVPEGEITINNGNRAFGVLQKWWYGEKRFRVGLDFNEAAFEIVKEQGNPEKLGKIQAQWVLPQEKVDARKVAQVGLSLEGPPTLLSGGENYRNIIMCSYAPEMLRVYNYSKADMLYKFSRHAMIGRFSNYPGYYISEFTNLVHDEDYPYKGPDMTSFYYHQAPAFFAQSLDYLVAQAEGLTGFKVRFPYVRQQGYVWFTDRIFGGGIGEFFGEKAKLKLDKKAVRTDSAKVSVLTARAENAVWALLINDSTKDLDVNLQINPASRLLKDMLMDADLDVYDANAQKLFTLPARGEKKVKIRALNAIAVRISVAHEDFSKMPEPLKDGHIILKDVGKPWGDLHAFRIRSAFGKDSIYVMLTGKPSSGKIKIKFESPQIGELSRSSEPFELSLYPVKVSEKLRFKVELEDKSKNVITTPVIEL